MGLTSLPLIEIAQSLPAQTRIDPEWLNEQLALSGEKQHARQYFYRARNAARRKAEKILRDSRRLAREQQKKWADENTAWRQAVLAQMEGEWLEKHVKRLNDDDETYRQWVDLAAERIQSSIEQVLSAWFDQQPIDQTLCHRLAKQAQSMAKEGAICVRIHPDRQALIQDTFGERFTVVVDPGIPPDKAELSSVRSSVSFSLEEHFRQLQEWLRHTGTTGGNDGAENQRNQVDALCRP